MVPTGAVVNPGDDEEFEAGEPVQPVVVADDDFGVKAVSLTADGEPVETMDESPYTFEWIPSEDEQGETVTLEATIEDSSGQTVTSSVDVEVTEKTEPPVEEPPVVKPVIEEPPTKAPEVKYPPTTFWLGKVLRDKKAGTALVEVEVSGPGKLGLSGDGVKPLSSEITTGGLMKIAVKAAGTAKQALKTNGQAKVKPVFTFTPTGGTAMTRMDVFFLVKKKP
jgi:hypothetical protein